MVGWGVALALLTAVGFDWPELRPAWGAWSIALLAVVGWMDDRKGLGALPRLVAHILAAMLVLPDLVLRPEDLGIIDGRLAAVAGILLTLLGVVWFINLYNFMDGMDGLAGGMAVIGFSSIGALGLENQAFSAAAFTLAAACGGFLLLNLPPARLFMGDAGSGVLGLLAAISILWGVRLELFGLAAGLLVFSPFIADATFTLVRRAMRGERVWQAHRRHLYQRLVTTGFGYRRTLFLGYGLMMLCGLSALLYQRLSGVAAVALILAWVLCYTVLLTTTAGIGWKAPARGSSHG